MCMDCCLKPYGTFQKKKKKKTTSWYFSHVQIKWRTDTWLDRKPLVAAPVMLQVGSIVQSSHYKWSWIIKEAKMQKNTQLTLTRLLRQVSSQAAPLCLEFWESIKWLKMKNVM